MERLQTALEKARQRRTSSPQAVRGIVTPDTLVNRWERLTELNLDTQTLQRNRLVAVSSTPEAAAYDLLRTKLLRMNRQNGWKRIAIVSPGASAGKSTTVTNLAFSFSRQSDVRAMAFDFDLRRPSMARLLQQKMQTNMGQVLRREIPFEDHALRYGKNLAFALNSSASRHSAELLQSSDTEDLISGLETTYGTDLILFDMPPLLVADDAHGFLRTVDAALIVMEAEKTPIKQIDVVERQVAELTNVAGIVLNKCNYSDDVYGSNYGGYY